MGLRHTIEDHRRAAGWIIVLPLMGRSRSATRWIAVVPLGRSPSCLPSLGGSRSWVARFCGGFGCGWVCSWLVLAFDGLDWWLVAVYRLVKNMGFVGLWWWIVAGGKSMVGFAVDWLWVGGWVGLTQQWVVAVPWGAVRWREGREGEDREIKMNSDKKIINRFCGYILFYCIVYVILLC